MKSIGIVLQRTYRKNTAKKKNIVQHPVKLSNILDL